MHVITSANRSALDGVRHLLNVGLTEAELTNETILSDPFLRVAEYQLYEALGLSGDSDYDAKIGTAPRTAAQESYRSRSMIAVTYLTAIQLIPSLPQLIEESILRESVRYQEIDWEAKSALLKATAEEVLDPIAPINAFDKSIFGIIEQDLSL